MQNAVLIAATAGVILPGASGMARAAQPATARRIIAEHCIEYHSVPGFAAGARNRGPAKPR